MKKTILFAALLCMVALGTTGSLAERRTDSEYIAFLALPEGIYVMRPDGSGLKKLAVVTDEFGGNPIWSPDGSRLAYVKVDHPGSALYTVSLDGSAPVKLINDQAIIGGLAWSPDGRKIAFDSRARTIDQIYVVVVDSGSKTRLAASSSLDGEPEWSPDGKFIAYDSALELSSPTQIKVMTSDGSSPVQLTTGTAYNWGARWAPDGKKIAFASNRDGHPQIYTMNPDGSEQRNLTSSEFDDSAPQWSPDGQFIAFRRVKYRVNGVNNSTEVYVARQDSVTPVHIEYRDGNYLINYSEQSFAWSPDGRQIALAVCRREIDHPSF